MHGVHSLFGLRCTAPSTLIVSAVLVHSLGSNVLHGVHSLGCSALVRSICTLWAAEYSTDYTHSLDCTALTFYAAVHYTEYTQSMLKCTARKTLVHRQTNFIKKWITSLRIKNHFCLPGDKKLSF